MKPQDEKRIKEMQEKVRRKAAERDRKNRIWGTFSLAIVVAFIAVAGWTLVTAGGAEPHECEGAERELKIAACALAAQLAETGDTKAVAAEYDRYRSNHPNCKVIVGVRANFTDEPDYNEFINDKAESAIAEAKGAGWDTAGATYEAEGDWTELETGPSRKPATISTVTVDLAQRCIPGGSA